jgi:hypothetical protein
VGIRGLDAEEERRPLAASALMALTGRPDGPPLCPSGLVRGLDRVAEAVAHWSAENGSAVEVNWAELVTARAAVLGLRRRGRISANGTCRLLRGPGGWMALNLPRPEDLAAVDAIVESPAGSDPWEAVRRALAATSVAHVVGRARLLGVPAAPLGQVTLPAAPAWEARPWWPRAGQRAIADLRIVDLSSMWAGPLAAKLLAQAGASVVKVESTSRPDGARAVPGFYRALHPDDQPVVTVDLDKPEGKCRLRTLLDEADVVIESSRRRALEQIGCGPRDAKTRDGRVWLSITGYGRGAPGSDWVAFGDDAAVAGGLVAWEDDEHPVFCGDALADPVTGMMAAAATFEAIATGGGVLLDVSMQACAASLARPSSPGSSRSSLPLSEISVVEDRRPASRG